MRKIAIGAAFIALSIGVVTVATIVKPAVAQSVRGQTKVADQFDLICGDNSQHLSIDLVGKRWCRRVGDECYVESIKRASPVEIVLSYPSQPGDEKTVWVINRVNGSLNYLNDPPMACKPTKYQPLPEAKF